MSVGSGGTGTGTGGVVVGSGGCTDANGCGVSTGGTIGSTGGIFGNSGGTLNATGGTLGSTGGTMGSTGGAPMNTGGETAAGGTLMGTGGIPDLTGGTMNTGGTDAVTGGTNGDTGGTSGETGGGAGSPGAAGTGGGVDVPTLVEPIARSGNSYVLEFGDLFFEVDADVGARIVSFKLGDTEILVPKSHVSSGDETMQNNYGSTFWTSPQADWNWPPIPEVDSDPYSEAAVDANSFTLESDVASVNGKQISIVKKFTAELAQNRIRIDYTIHNSGSSSAEFAPWEIGRVTSGGLTFFPTGPGGTRAPTMTEMELVEGSGIAWLDWTGSGPSAESKYIGDGAEGWLAHAQDGLLLLRTFPDIALNDAAAGEADVELYANLQYEYVETEPQGALASIPGGGDSTWTIYWQLVSIPEDVAVEARSETLVTFARSIAALAPAAG